MKNGIDFVSALLILVFACTIFVVVYVAINNLVTSFENGKADAALYNKPTWYDLESESSKETTEEVVTEYNED